jgi:hypothetical protein
MTNQPFDLETASGRYLARKAGHDVPKMKPGVKRPDFESCIDKSADCWPWTGARNPWGYGVFTENKRTIQAHRRAYELAVGPIPTGHVVMHKCDNPACCNPAHLAIGTHADNQHDKTAKGRQAKGSGNGWAKLSESDVLEIRTAYERHAVTHKMLAKQYGVCRDTIHKVVNRVYWRHV